MKRIAFGFVCGCLWAACGGTDHLDPTGIYQVSADVGSSPCGADLPIPMAPAYVHFKQQDFFGAKYYAYEGCSDAAGTTCDGNFNGVFAEPVTNGYKSQITSWSPSNGTCSISYQIGIMTLKSGALSIDIEQHEGSEMIPDAQCTDTEAQSKGPTLPCTMHEHIDATMPQS